MARLLWLPDVLRAAGLTVHDVPGWRTRGSDAMWERPAGVICHATAGSRTSTPAGDIGVLINGSATAPGPISQTYLARNGDWHIVASGLCYHAGKGGLWGVTGNAPVVGVEAANDNRGEPWPAAQYDSYVLGVGAILRHLDRPASRAGAHREWSSTGKTDPVGIDMPTFRGHVAAAIAGNYQEDDMAEFTPEHARKLDELHRLIYDGKRLMDPQTSNGGVPIPWLPRAFHHLGVDLDQLYTEVDGVEESQAHLTALVQAIQAGDPAALAEALVAVLPAAVAKATADTLSARLTT